MIYRTGGDPRMKMGEGYETMGFKSEFEFSFDELDGQGKLDLDKIHRSMNWLKSMVRNDLLTQIKPFRKHIHPTSIFKEYYIWNMQ